MKSLQSGVTGLIVKSFRSTLFIHKTGVATQRHGFERISKISKFPRFVEEEPCNLGGMDARWFIPRKVENSNKVILYLHGGAYCVGSVNTHRALIARIARASKCKAVGINYRLAPEHPFPGALEDAYNAYLNLVELGVEDIIVAGDSAGGGLTLSLMQKLREEQLKMPRASVLISPWVDLTHSGESIRTKASIDPLIDPALLDVFASKYYQHHNPKDPLISPLFADLRGLPPTLIQVGGNEVLLDDATRIAKKLNKSDVAVDIQIWKKQMHVWHWMGGIVPEANKAIRAIGKFVKNQFRSGENNLEEIIDSNTKSVTLRVA